MVTRKVAAKKRKTVLKFTDNYRQFSEQRRQLRALESQLQDRLDQYEKALINQARKPLGFQVRPSPTVNENSSANANVPAQKKLTPT
jgi:hypothetical protein